jgi:hypothetical protein
MKPKACPCCFVNASVQNVHVASAGMPFCFKAFTFNSTNSISDKGALDNFSCNPSNSGGGTATAGPAKPVPVCYSRIIETPLSQTFLR